MSEYKYDAIVYIGRFEPFHNGHANTILHACKLAKKVIVLIGSANEPRTFKNPFTYQERVEMISAWAENQNDIEAGQLVPAALENSIYSDEAWAVRVQEIVKEWLLLTSKHKIAIIGHKKDGSSFYLDMFPQWEFVEESLVDPLDATSIRDIYFSEKCNFNWFKGVLPPEVVRFLANFQRKEGPKHDIWNVDYLQIIKERKFLTEHAKQYEMLKYPPIFVTVDAGLIQAGHILMVKRRAEPGKGLWALPGGYVNAKTDRSIEDAMIRELREETQIKVPDKVLRGSIEEVKVFDALERSERGRIITHAHKIDLKEVGLPKVKGADDAEKAKWIPLAEVKRSETFEDHYDIIQYFLGR